jgi:hypothetical protein
MLNPSPSGTVSVLPVTGTENTTNAPVGNNKWHNADVTGHTAPCILHGSIGP